MTSGNDGNLTIHLDKQLFDKREKISFYIENNDQTNNPIASLSVSVSEYFPGATKEPSISDYFVASKDNPRIGDASNVICKFIPEFTGAVLQGRVVNRDRVGSGISIPSEDKRNHTLLLSTIDSITNLQFTTTDSLGSFAFHLNPWYEGKEIIIKLKETVNATIELDEKTDMIRPFIPSESYNIKGIKEYLAQLGKVVQIQRYYRKSGMLDTVKMFPHSHTIPRVYYKSNSLILPSDYIELPDFIELSREIIPALKISKKQNNFESRYVNLRYQTDSDDKPAIFLDGVPIDDINQIITLGTTEINRIESLPAIRYYGELSFPGILSVFSTNLEINNIIYKTPVVRYQVFESRSYTKPVLFKPESIIEHNPDLRQLLLWKPDIRPERDEHLQIECYASDIEGKYRINVQGISENGNPVSGSAIITIQSK
jgi:hypothetical protein